MGQAQSACYGMMAVQRGNGFIERVTHGIRRGRFDLGPRSALRASVCVALLVSAAALYLLLVSDNAARGRRIEQLRVELLRLQRENEQLEVEIARQSSVTRLLERAAELGFVPVAEIDVMPIDQ